MFQTDPRHADTDNDGLPDRADPQPTVRNTTLPSEIHAIFTQSSSDTTGESRVKLVETRYQQNHLVYAPHGATSGPLLLYQTYLADVNEDGNYNEVDLTASAIGIMNVDGTRPRILTDLNGAGAIQNNGFIDATPHFSPDGRYIIFVSNRADGGSNTRLWVMGHDGGNPRQIQFSDTAHAPILNQDADIDVHWGADNRIAWTRERFSQPSQSGRIMTGTLDPTLMTISHVSIRTNSPLGDHDPQVSPNGEFIASYRHLNDSLVIPFEPPFVIGEWDFWVGLYSQSGTTVSILNANPVVADFFPRWNATGDKLALWAYDHQAMQAGKDPVDIVIVDLAITTSPFSVTATNRRNITKGADAPIQWNESMPSWQTDPAKSDQLIYDAIREE
ncbi:MAG: hypothetical protein OEV01_15300 [Nitrospira sp.]|nr:hypothetical protein [Nitrospira sp.]